MEYSKTKRWLKLLKARRWLKNHFGWLRRILKWIGIKMVLM